jgi:hypothetical protein
LAAGQFRELHFFGPEKLSLRPILRTPGVSLNALPSLQHRKPFSPINGFSAQPKPNENAAVQRQYRRERHEKTVLC